MSEHGTVRRFWSGCRCLHCRAARAEYSRERYRIRNNGLMTVPADRVRQLLLQFETSREAAAAISMHYTTCADIRSGRKKTLRITTEKRILEAVAA